jgi:hypothetical protein
MARLVRRTSTSGTRYPLRRAKATAKKATPARKKAVKRKAAAKRRVAAPAFIPRIKTMMNNLNLLIKRRKKEFGPNDRIAKSLSKIQSTISKEIKKNIALNPSLVRHIKKVGPTLRNISKTPAALKGIAPKLGKFLRDHARREAKTFLNNVNKTLAPMQRELNRLETKLNASVKKARSQKIQWKVTPKLRARMKMLNNKINRFKKSYGKQLTALATHGNQEVKRAVIGIKKQLDECQRCISRNVTILNRYSGAKKAKKGFKTKPLFTAKQAQTMESKWNQIKKHADQTRGQFKRFVEQLKAIKLF